MKWILFVLCYAGTIAASAFVKSLDLNGVLTAALVVPMVLLTVVSLAYAQPGPAGAKSRAEAGGIVSRPAEATE